MDIFDHEEKEFEPIIPPMDIFNDTNNELEYIVLDIPEIDIFIRDRRCANCLSRLSTEVHDDEKGWLIVCHVCRIAIIKSGHIHVSQAEQIASDRLAGLRELRPDKPPRPAADILEELGF